eukprot:jgi/Astpho2/4773/fgenesh1_pm.00067_%23_74_t
MHALSGGQGGLQLLHLLLQLRAGGTGLCCRLPWLAHDWKSGFTLRVLAPATYIFFASAIPALAFGQQFIQETDGILSAVQVLTATGLCGIIQAIFGGQPLLIVGVAEPIVLVYKFMYDFAIPRASLGRDLFLAWAAWTCVWAALMIFLVAASGACRHIDRFTAFSGELFGMLIAMLFIQQTVEGLKAEFRVATGPGAVFGACDEPSWRLANGCWSLFIASGVICTTLLMITGRSWRFGGQALRGFLADYGVPLMVVVFSCLAYAVVGSTPSGVPRRMSIPNTWDEKTNWTVAGRMSAVPGAYIAGALIPALIITVLFYFDHSVSSQLAQTANFNLRKPSAYSYDFYLLGGMTMACGLLGIPPVNGVLPQAPMHTKSLATMRTAIVRSELQQSYETATETDVESQTAPAPGDAAPGPEHAIPTHALEVERQLDSFLPTEVQEQRMSGLIQSLLCAACLAITPLLKYVPTSVLWGYFSFMALQSLPGNDFWERINLMVTDPKLRYRSGAEPYLEAVRFRVIVAFTILQLCCLGAVYGVTWAGIVGVIFPVLIIALVPIRQFIFPLIFSDQTLYHLDPAPYEAVPAGITRPRN